jgi:hypothetical protein
MVKTFTPSDELVEKCLLVRDVYDPRPSMTSFLRWDVTDSIKYHFKGLDFTGGNIFYHELPFEVHTDLFDNIARTTVIVPLQVDTKQKLIVFDQSYTEETYHSSVVWSSTNEGDYVIGSKHCKMIYDKPSNYNVTGMTDEECPRELTDHLPATHEFYHGLSGKAYDYSVGTGFIFDSSLLHATGKMEQGKYGLSMWFNNTPEEVYECLT